MKSDPNSVTNLPGDSGGALGASLGCPRGPRLNCGSGKLVRWTSWDTLMGSTVRVLFNAEFMFLFDCWILYVGMILHCLKRQAHPEEGQKEMENVCF